jgi:hypothetical protein
VNAPNNPEPDGLAVAPLPNSPPVAAPKGAAVLPPVLNKPPAVAVDAAAVVAGGAPNRLVGGCAPVAVPCCPAVPNIGLLGVVGPLAGVP